MLRGVTLTVPPAKTPPQVPFRPRLAGGRVPLWRSRRCVQLGLDPRYALVVDGLSPGLAELVRGLDGGRTADELVAAAIAAGADEAEATGLLAELAAAGVIEDAGVAGRVPPGLAADVADWTLRCGPAAGELLTRRAAATVDVHGNGRVAVAVAVLLSSSGVGCVRTHATGRVTVDDVGTGYRHQDVGRDRRQAATAAIGRHRAPGGRPPSGAITVHADVAVLADAAMHDPALVARLVSERVPHLAVQAREGKILVGPLVLPGRTGCLGCVGLHRGDRDPAWPRLAAQLTGRPPVTALAGAAVAAGMATEQVLAVLAGAGEPATIGATLELDPLSGHLARRRRPPHHRCGCGAARPG
jgi:bacteriocin biosynthesis cyclodehydratase domain-containing protein